MLSTSAAVMLDIPAVPANPYRLAWARLLRLPRLLTENIRSPCSRCRAAREGEKEVSDAVGRPARAKKKFLTLSGGPRGRKIVSAVRRAARRSSDSLAETKESLAEVRKTSAKKKSRSPKFGKRRRRKRAARRSSERFPQAGRGSTPQPATKRNKINV